MNKQILLVATLLIFASVSSLKAQKAKIHSNPDPTLPGGRHALVIGNGEYRNASVSAPVENARLVADALRAKGFTVIYAENASVKTMKNAIKTFSERLEAAVSVVYYAGHSLTVDGKFFLVPSDAMLKKPSDAEYECVELDYLTNRIDRNPMNLVLLETGTDKKFRKLWPEINQSSSILFPAMENTLVVVSTDPAQQIGQNQMAQGMFTREFLKQIQVPDESAQKALRRTITEVHVTSGGLQKPIISGQAVAFFKFSPEVRQADATLVRETGRRRLQPQ